jgi:hypothetical protein
MCPSLFSPIRPDNARDDRSDVIIGVNNAVQKSYSDYFWSDAGMGSADASAVFQAAKYLECRKDSLTNLMP